MSWQINKSGMNSEESHNLFILFRSAMSTLDPVRGIRISFATAGYNLNLTTNIYFKIVIWALCGFHLILANGFVIRDILADAFVVRDISHEFPNVSLIQNAIHKYKVSMFWIYHHSLLIKSGQIALLAKSLAVHLKPNQIRKCFFISFSVLIWTSSYLLISVVTLYIPLFEGATGRLAYFGFPDNVLSRALFFLTEIILFSKIDWPTTIDMIYIILFFTLYLAKRNLLRKINFQKNPKLIIATVYQVTNTISDLHDMFESTMSMYPFLTITYLFFSISQNLYMIRVMSESMGVWLIVTIAIRTSSSLSLILFTNHFKSKFDEDTKQVCKTISTDERLSPSERSALITAVKETSKQKMTGWGMFEIDLPLILAFLASNVTFTLLFLS